MATRNPLNRHRERSPAVATSAAVVDAAVSAATNNAQQIALSAIRVEPDKYQLRANGLDDDHIADLRETLRETELEPVELVQTEEGQLILAHGFHRYEAYRLEARSTLPALIFPGTEIDAFDRAVAANQKHGLKRTNADKRNWVVRILLHPVRGAEWSNNEIARRAGVSAPFVGKVRKELEEAQQIEPVTQRTVVRNGHVYTQNTQSIGRPTQPHPTPQPATQSPPATSETAPAATPDPQSETRAEAAPAPAAKPQSSDTSQIPSRQTLQRTLSDLCAQVDTVLAARPQALNAEEVRLREMVESVRRNGWLV